jgi:hypothetical protein
LETFFSLIFLCVKFRASSEVQIRNTNVSSPPPPLQAVDIKGATTVKKKNIGGAGGGGKRGRGRGRLNGGGGTAASGVGRGAGERVGNLSKTMSNLTIDNSVNAVRTWTAAVEQQQQQLATVPPTPASSDGDDSFSKFIRDD